MREDEDGHAELRLVAPPSRPVRVIGEGMKPENPGAHDLRADSLEVPSRELVIDTGGPFTGRVTEDP
jgi:hypothetical protein